MCVVEEICGWTGQIITAMEPTIFRVKIGPSGGLRGYEYITGELECDTSFYIVSHVYLQVSQVGALHYLLMAC